jgi:hypothetical protein
LAFCWFLTLVFDPQNVGIYDDDLDPLGMMVTAHQNWIEVLQQGKNTLLTLETQKFRVDTLIHLQFFWGQQLKDFHAFNFNKTYFSQSKTRKFQ